MTQEVETVADFGEGPAATAARWISELDQAEKFWKPYQKRCETILTRYEDERDKESEGRRKFSIFWSNIETLKPACYARVPQATVLRRNNDPDKVAKVAAEVLERAINFSLECYDFDQVLKDVRDEFLILAKGQSWARYVPTFGEAPQTAGVEAEAKEEKPGLVGGLIDMAKGAFGIGQKPVAQAEPPQQVVTYEEAVCDYVSYQDWGTNKCRKWAETRFLWRKCYMDRAALKKRFTAKHEGTGKTIGELVPLDFKPENAEGDQYGQAIVYEIWDKPSKSVIWISKSFPATPLDERPDLLGLKDFWPCPKPAFGTLSPRKIIPIPDYVQYQDQCEELDDLTGRISAITKALKMVGIYAGDQNETLQNLLAPENENKIIPIDGWAVLAERGGLKGLIEYLPIEQVYNVLKGLYESREACIKIIYQICAIPDIMRGDTDPDETAAAQGLKSTWGSSRMREKQKEMARFARDVMGIKGEIIAKKFSIETMKQMTGVQLLTRAELQQIQMWQQAATALQAQQQQMAQAQPPAAGQLPGQPPQPAPPPAQPPPPPFPPEKMELATLPTWEDVDALLKSDQLRSFRIDIEADSTVEPDLVSDKRDATEYITAIGGMFSGALPVIQALPPLAKPFASVIKAVTRKFQLGRQVEEDWDKALGQIAQMPPQQPEQQGKSPEELQLEQSKVAVAQQKNQIAQQKLQSEEANSQRDAVTNAASVQAEQHRIAMEERNAQMDKVMERMMAFLDRQTRLDEASIEASTRRYEADKGAEAAKAKGNGAGVSAQ